jgi:SNF family Na+-dependent transporter
MVLFVRGVTLPGALDGIRYLFVPDWYRLQDLAVWRAAAAQVAEFVSLVQ